MALLDRESWKAPVIVLILAFDTSGFSGSVALLDGPRVLAEALLASEQRSAQTLAPAIVNLLSEARCQANDVRLVATTCGPGSFTGLRVGITTAKTFAYAVGAEVVAVSTLEAIAQQAPPDHRDEDRSVHAVLDAQRRELFVGIFHGASTAGAEVDCLSWSRREVDRLMSADDWLTSLKPGDVVIGSGLKKIASQVRPDVNIAPEIDWQPRASTVGRLAWRDYQAGRRDDLWSLAPVYLRPSYAEEKVKTEVSGQKPDSPTLTADL